MALLHVTVLCLCVATDSRLLYTPLHILYAAAAAELETYFGSSDVRGYVLLNPVYGVVATVHYMLFSVPVYH